MSQLIFPTVFELLLLARIPHRDRSQISYDAGIRFDRALTPGNVARDDHRLSALRAYRVIHQSKYPSASRTLVSELAEHASAFFRASMRFSCRMSCCSSVPGPIVANTNSIHGFDSFMPAIRLFPLTSHISRIPGTRKSDSSASRSPGFCKARRCIGRARYPWR